MLFREVNFDETRKRARRVLNQYRRLIRITGRSPIDLKSPILSDMPRGGQSGNGSEDAIIQRMDAERELDRIEQALKCLSAKSRHVLYYSFCVQDKFTNIKIGGLLGYSDKSVEYFKRDALVEFAEAYGVVVYF